jgi:DNA-binding CsgD family transcriptional regulator
LKTARAVWQTPLARALMHTYFAAAPGQVPETLLAWLREQSALAAEGRDLKPLTVAIESKQLVFSLQERTSDDDWLMVMREVSDAAVVDALLQAFKLTMKEAEVLYWVVKGKTNRDIGDILGSSPATVKKHLEHVFEKLGVETRNAAASLAIKKVRLLSS